MCNRKTDIGIFRRLGGIMREVFSATMEKPNGARTKE